MEGGLEKIQTLEDSMVRLRDEKTSEERGQAPVFTVPLANIESLREGESAHFEGRLTPTNDPRLKVSFHKPVYKTEFQYFLYTNYRLLAAFFYVGLFVKN